MSYGDIYRIVNGYDDCGNVCGRENSFTDESSPCRVSINANIAASTSVFSKLLCCSCKQVINIVSFYCVTNYLIYVLKIIIKYWAQNADNCTIPAYKLLINFPHREKTIHYKSICVSCRLEPMPLIKRKSIECALNHATATLDSKYSIVYMVLRMTFVYFMFHVKQQSLPESMHASTAGSA